MRWGASLFVSPLRGNACFSSCNHQRTAKERKQRHHHSARRHMAIENLSLLFKFFRTFGSFGWWFWIGWMVHYHLRSIQMDHLLNSNLHHYIDSGIGLLGLKCLLGQKSLKNSLITLSMTKWFVCVGSNEYGSQVLTKHFRNIVHQGSMNGLRYFQNKFYRAGQAQWSDQRYLISLQFETSLNLMHG